MDVEHNNSLFTETEIIFSGYNDIAKAEVPNGLRLVDSSTFRLNGIETCSITTTCFLTP